MLSLVALLCFSSGTRSAELDYAHVERSGSRFTIEFRIKLLVREEKMRDYMRDFAALAKASPTTVESGLIESPEHNGKLLRVVMRPCVLVFCKKLVKVSQIDNTDSVGMFVRNYRVLPELSNFTEATETVELTGEGDGTVFTYHAILEPKFYVPGFMGGWLIRRTLVADLMATAVAVERGLENTAATHR